MQNTDDIFAGTYGEIVITDPRDDGDEHYGVPLAIKRYDENSIKNLFAINEGAQDDQLEERLRIARKE